MENSQYDAIATQYHQETERDLFLDNKRRLTTELIDRPKIHDASGWDVLDIGCGTGIHLEFFAENYPEISSATGIDQSAGMVAVANLKKRSPKTSYTVSDMDTLPFADSSFDFIYSINAVHYSNDLAITFAGINRVLKPQGRMFFQVNHPIYNLFMKASKIYTQKESLEYEIQGGKARVVHPTYTLGEYVNAIASNDLRVAELNEYNGRSSRVDGYTVPTVLSMIVEKPGES